MADLHKGIWVTVTTSEANGHEHTVVVRYKKIHKFYYIYILAMENCINGLIVAGTNILPSSP